MGVIVLTEELFIILGISFGIAIILGIMVAVAVFTSAELRFRVTGRDFRIITMKMKSGGFKDNFASLGSIKDGMWQNKYAVEDSQMEFRQTRIGGRRLWGFVIEDNPQMFKPSTFITESYHEPELTTAIAKKRIKSNLRAKWIGSLGTDWIALIAMGAAIGAVVVAAIVAYQFDAFSKEQYYQNDYMQGALKNVTDMIRRSGGSVPINGVPIAP